MAGDIKVTPEDVKELGRTCRETSKRVTDVATDIKNKIQGTNWESDASRKFDADWEKHEKALRELQQSLDQLGEAAQKMGQNYADADAAYGGAS